MPGTIRVSVLEFMDLPMLSSSPLSIKVSMGRRHYEAWDKGDFSFPLTTLRDDVILVIRDAEGNEISRAGVQVKSIVEKGYWDDLFPLEGGGHVHLQFQFALSEDDRNRIRMMRETVLKRKHAELQQKNLKSSGSNLAPSFYLNPELSDSQKCLIQIGDLSSKEAAHQSPTPSTENSSDNEKEKPSSENAIVIPLDHMQQLSAENDAFRNEDNSSTAPMMQEVDVKQSHVNNTAMVERIETQSPDVNKPSQTIHSEENLFHSQGAECSNAPSESEEKTLDSAPSYQKTPSNVKKVISVFESSLTQDSRPRVKPTLRNTQFNVVEKQASLKEKRPKLGPSATTLNPPLEREVKQELAHVKREEEKCNAALDITELSKDPWQSLKLKGKKSQTGSEQDKIIKEHKEMDAKNDDESYPKLMSTIKSETDMVSERMTDGHSITQQPSKVLEKPDDQRKSVSDESKTRRSSINSREINTEGTSANEVKSISCIKDEQFSSKSYGGWIFPDEGRRLCVTAGGNQMLDLVGGRTSNTFMHTGEMKISMEENRGTSETKANEGKHDHQKMVKPEGSEDAHTFEGPLANVLKIAIMIGFGTLVLLTRQRKKKK